MADNGGVLRLCQERLGPWFAADPRALGLFRIAFGLLGFWDLFRRIPYVTIFYSNDGVLSNHFALFRPAAGHHFTLFHLCSKPEEAALLFGLIALCLFFFTIGYRTRLFHVLAGLGMISLHTRNVLIENGGDVVHNLWWLWTLFLPLGARYSVDALRKRWNSKGPPRRAPVWSLAVFAILMQLAVIYLFNAVHKDGAAWRDGSALAWVLHQDRIATHIGMAMRDLPMWFHRIGTFGALAIEWAAPFLLLTPIFSVWARRVAIVTLCGLHLGIWLMTDVGLFSWQMMVAYILLLSAPDFDLMKRWLRRLAGEPVKVFYDSDCGVCSWCAKLGARLDRLALVTWVGREEEEPPPGWDAERLEREREETIIVVGLESGRVWLREAGIARIVAALPGCRPFAWLMRMPPAGLIYPKVATNRHRISAWLGMGVCGVPWAATPELEETAPSAALTSLLRARWVLAQVVLVWFMTACTYQVLTENRWFRGKVKVAMPSWARATIQYGRWFQGWSMFAPGAPLRDGHLVIEAELEDGTIVDPQTGKAPVIGPATFGPRDWDQFWGSYSMRIAGSRNQRYRRELGGWIERPTRHFELSAEQKIKRYAVWWIGDRSPRPLSGKAPKIFERYVVAERPKGFGKERDAARARASSP